MRLIYSLALVLVIAASGCASGVSSQSEHVLPGTIPPGNCRVFATVVRIDSVQHEGPPGSPCSKAPCFARIRIDRVIGYGPGTAGIRRGETLLAKFAFTLGRTTKSEFPSLIRQLPGLSTGDSFTADIELIPSNPRNSSRERIYLVYGYEKSN